MRLRAGWLGAAVLVLWASCVQAQVDEPETAGQTGQQDRPAETLPLPLPVDIIEDEAEAKARQAAQERAEQREIDDLAAQQGMDQATQRMVDLSEKQTWLIAIGTFLLFTTLLLTLQANRAAIRAAKAAERSVDVTQDIGQRQIRAYVTVWDVHIHNFRKGGHPFIRYVIDNRGQTPATIVKFGVGIRTVDDPNRDPIKGIALGASEPGSVAVVGGVTSLKQRENANTIIEDRLFSQVISEKRYIIFGAFLVYKDIFGKTHRTVTRAALVPGTIQNDICDFKLCSRNNRMS